MNHEKPTLRKRNGDTLVDVVIDLDAGLDLRPSRKFVGGCLTFLGDERKAFLLDKSGNEYDCKSVFRIVSAEAYNGAKFTIQVQGQDEKAERYALRIYSALTSGDSFNLDFYQFEKDDDRQIK